MQSLVRVNAVLCQAGRADPAGEAAQQLAQVLNAASTAGAAFAQLYSVSVESTPGCLGGLLGKKSTYQQVDLAVCAPRASADAGPTGMAAAASALPLGATALPPAEASAQVQAPQESEGALSPTAGANPAAAETPQAGRAIQGKWIAVAGAAALMLVWAGSNLFSSRPAAPTPSVAAPSPAAVPDNSIPASWVVSTVPSTGPQALNNAWFGTWRSENGLLVATFTANQVREQITRTEGGKTTVDTGDYPWAQDITKVSGPKAYSAYMLERTSSVQLSKWLESRLKPGVDYTPPPAAPARNALSQLSAGVYKVVLVDSPEGDCTRSSYLVDGNRMLRWGDCKYGTWMDLLTRQ